MPFPWADEAAASSKTRPHTRRIFAHGCRRLAIGVGRMCLALISIAFNNITVRRTILIVNDIAVLIIDNETWIARRRACDYVPAPGSFVVGSFGFGCLWVRK